MRLFKRLTLVAFLFSLILPGKLYAQGVPTPDENLLSGFDWRYVGPAIAGGRITDVEIVLDDPSHWFIGAASGGIFESRKGNKDLIKRSVELVNDFETYNDPKGIYLKCLDCLIY